MKSTESDVCYFEVDAVFNGEPVELLEESRVVRGSILCNPTQPNPSADWPNPTHYNEKIWTQPDLTQY